MVSAQDLVLQTAAQLGPEEQRLPQPAPSQPALYSQSPAEDRSWLSSALDKPEQLQRWSIKTPRPALPVAPDSSALGSQEDPIQSAEVPRPPLHSSQASPAICAAEAEEPSRRGPGWRTAAHRLGVAPHRSQPRQPQAQADLISPYHGPDGQPAPAHPKQAGNELPASSAAAHAAKPYMQQDSSDGQREPASEPEMRKRRSAPARALSEDPDENQAAQHLKPADSCKSNHLPQQPVRYGMADVSIISLHMPSGPEGHCTQLQASSFHIDVSIFCRDQMDARPSSL